MTGTTLLLALYGALGMEPGRATDRGHTLGDAVRIGDVTRYHDREGRTLGTAQRTGAEIVVRDARGRTIERVRTRR